MPQMGDLMRSGIIYTVNLSEGMAISPGTKLMDVYVDLSAAAPQDCPMSFHFRAVSRERGFVRRLQMAVGESKEVGELLALISTDPDEALEVPVTRSLRITTAGIVKEADW